MSSSRAKSAVSFRSDCMPWRRVSIAAGSSLSSANKERTVRAWANRGKRWMASASITETVTACRLMK